MKTFITIITTVSICFGAFGVLDSLRRNRTVFSVEPNCEAWFEPKGTGASLECPDAGIAMVIRGEGCRYALQNGKKLKLKCDGFEVNGEIK